MAFIKNMLNRSKESFSKYAGNKGFLDAACAAAAMVVYADGKAEDSEIDAAASGLADHELLSSIYSPAEIDAALNAALASAKTRVGKMGLNRALEGLGTQSIELRQDVFLIAADVADVGNMDDTERNTLMNIAKTLGVDGAKLLGV